MKRFKVLFGQRRFQALLVIAAIMLASSVIAASGANFTSQSANVGNTFTAGNLRHTNNGATLTVSGLKPDDTEVYAGSVTLTNDGDLDGHFTMSSANLAATNTIPGHTGDLSTVLQLRVARGGTDVYSGPINGAIVDRDAGNIGAGTAATYDFYVTFPDGLMPADPADENSGDNAYKGGQVVVDFVWTAVNL